MSLAVVVGFFDLIPLVGAMLGAIIVALSTATVDFPTATIVWWRSSSRLPARRELRRPTARRRPGAEVNPLVTILSVLVGASLLGVLGALLAMPIAAAIQIVLRDWWANRGTNVPAAGHRSP